MKDVIAQVKVVIRRHFVPVLNVSARRRVGSALCPLPRHRMGRYRKSDRGISLPTLLASAGLTLRKHAEVLWKSGTSRLNIFVRKAVAFSYLKFV